MRELSDDVGNCRQADAALFVEAHSPHSSLLPTPPAPPAPASHSLDCHPSLPANPNVNASLKSQNIPNLCVAASDV